MLNCAAYLLAFDTFRNLIKGYFKYEVFQNKYKIQVNAWNQYFNLFNDNIGPQRKSNEVKSQDLGGTKREFKRLPKSPLLNPLFCTVFLKASVLLVKYLYYEKKVEYHLELTIQRHSVICSILEEFRSRLFDSETKHETLRSSLNQCCKNNM